MEINISEEQKAEITELYMKVGYAQNEIKKIEDVRRAETLAAEQVHDNNIKAINGKYAVELLDAQTTLAGFLARLQELGIKP